MAQPHHYSLSTSTIVADLTDRAVLGEFGITAAHSMGIEYGPAQELACGLFEAGFDGVVYRVRHDPAMMLESVALFGEPGETAGRFNPPKTIRIPESLLADARQFCIEVLPAAPLPWRYRGEIQRPTVSLSSRLAASPRPPGPRLRA